MKANGFSRLVSSLGQRIFAESLIYAAISIPGELPANQTEPDFGFPRKLRRAPGSGREWLLIVWTAASVAARFSASRDRGSRCGVTGSWARSGTQRRFRATRGNLGPGSKATGALLAFQLALLGLVCRDLRNAIGGFAARRMGHLGWRHAVRIDSTRGLQRDDYRSHSSEAASRQTLIRRQSSAPHK
jgi:hypothetical protein